MNDWQKEYVRKNLSELVDLTDCTRQIQDFLLANRILSRADVQHLEATRNLHGQIKQASELYDRLRGSLKGYENLTNALFTYKQSGPAKILLEGLKQHGIKDPLDHCGISFPDNGFEMASIMVIGKTHKIIDFFCDTEMDKIRNIFKENLPDLDYFELLTHKTPFVLVKDTIPLPPPFYVPRFMSNKIIINKDVFKVDCPDVFVFKGIERHQLHPIASPHFSSSSASQVDELTSRFIYLDHEQDWKVITDLAFGPVHLINCSLAEDRTDPAEDLFVLENTYGGSQLMRKFRSNKRDKYTTEDEFVTHQLAENNDSFGVCICDTPGMGKTLLLANIARSFAAENKRYITAFIQLTSFLESIKIRPLPSFEENEEQALFYLFSYVSTSNENALLLQKLSLNGLCWLNVLFDGFDEILLEEVDWIKKLVRTLIDKFIKVKVYITSRPHMRKDLEDTLQVIAYDMLPFNRQNQIDYLVHFWLKKKPNIFRENIEKCAKQCLRSARKLITAEDSEFTGIPLQCMLIAEIYADEAFSFCSTGRHTFSFTPRKTCDMYKLFIRKRISFATNDHAQIESILELHVKHAYTLHFPTYVDHQNDEFSDDTTKLILKIGIMQQTIDQEHQKLEFVHRTFAEYILAEYYADYFSSDRPGYYMSQNEMEFIVNAVMECEGISLWVHSGVIYFLDTLISQTSMSNYIPGKVITFCDSIPPDKLCKILYISCTKSTNIFRYWKEVIKIIADKNQIRAFFTKVRLFDLTTHIIESTSNIKLLLDCNQLIEHVFRFQFNHLSIEFPSRPSWVRTAARSGNYEAFEFLIDKCQFNGSELVKDCIGGSYHNSPDQIERKVNILKMIYCKHPALISEVPDIWHSTEIHLKLTKLLLEFGADMTTAKNRENLVCFSIKGRVCDSADFHELVQYLLVEQQAEFLFKESDSWNDPLPTIIENVELSPKTFGMILNIPEIDINRETDCENLLFHALRISPPFYGNVKELVKLGVDPHKLDGKQRSLLHLATNLHNVEMVRYFLSLGLDPRRSDENGNTPLHEVKGFITAELLMQNGADVYAKNIKGQSVLYNAATIWDNELIQNLLSKGLNLDDRDNDGNTVFHYCQDVSVMKRCVDLGSDIYAKNKYGRNALHTLCAAQSSSQILDEIKYLVSIGLRVNDIDWEGKTPLHYCTSLERIKCLVDLRADVHVKDNQGQTVLHTIGAGYADLKSEIFEYLVSLGLNINDQDKVGKTPLDYCKDMIGINSLVILGAHI